MVAAAALRKFTPSARAALQAQAAASSANACCSCVGCSNGRHNRDRRRVLMRRDKCAKLTRAGNLGTRANRLCNAVFGARIDVFVQRNRPSILSIRLPSHPQF